MEPSSQLPPTQESSSLRKLSRATLQLRQKVGLTRQQIASHSFSLGCWKLIMRSHPLVFQSDLFPQETALLLRLFREARPKTYLEVGVFWGGTFKRILEQRDALSLPTRCYGLDVWDEVPDAAANTHTSGWPSRVVVNEALQRCGFKNFDLLSGLSSQAGQLIPDRIDFAMHDANHTYAAVMEDLGVLHPLLADRATILVHNAGKEYEPDKTYYDTDGGPYRAIQDLVRSGKWEFVTLEYRLAVLKKLP